MTAAEDGPFEGTAEGTPEGTGEDPREPTRKLPDGAAEPPRNEPSVEARDEFQGMPLGDTVLQERIGEGGMGLVYKAWQEPPGRTVAVKLLRDALASDDARFRFRHEARILASLRHPTIAEIHSAGTHRATPEIPYLVMEYVPDALPITDYAAEHKLGIDTILALGARVCRGVQAGHAKGIIHRDLKPANILVDPAGDPKVIDFGIARAVHADDDASTPRTETGQLVGTVPYMSPEQFLGVREAIDTRSDVYALGVILYELLTGRLPHPIEGLGLMDAIQKIRQERPPSPPSLREDLSGDISVILLKALAKDPDARYASAEALADDIDRYRARRPILARPPSVTYELKLYARRHRGVFASLVALVLTVVVALVSISVFAAAESRARAHAERERQVAEDLLHTSAGFIPEVADHLDNKLTAISGTARVRQQLAAQLETLAERLAASPGADDDPQVAYAVGAAKLAVARIQGGVGGASLGASDTALLNFHGAVEHFRRAAVLRPDDDALLEALLDAQISLATQYSAAGQTTTARAILSEVKPPLAAWLARAPSSRAALTQGIDFERTVGSTAWIEGHPEPSLAAYERALALVAAFPWEPQDAAARQGLELQGHLDMATAFWAVQRGAEARPHYEALEALAKQIEANGTGSAPLLALWHVHDKLGEFAADNDLLPVAEGRHQRALAVAERMRTRDPVAVEGPRHMRISRGALAAVLEKAQKFEPARAAFVETLAALEVEQKLDPTNRVIQWDLRVTLTRLASVQSRLHQASAARQNLERARGIQTQRVEAMPGRAIERAGLAEVEFTDAMLHINEAGPGATRAESLALNAKARAALKQAIARLEALAVEGASQPSDEANLALWRRILAFLLESSAKLERTK